jgi:hypothetical protein
MLILILHLYLILLRIYVNDPLTLFTVRVRFDHQQLLLSKGLLIMQIVNPLMVLCTL